MKKYDKEILQTQLKHEKAVIKELKEMYEEAEKQIEEKIQMLMTDELTQSKIYQLEYQKALKGQIDAILDNMNSNNYDSIQSYLKQSYEDGYIGTMYSLQQQGIPLIMPINQEQVIKAIQLDSKVSGTLYEAMGVNTKDLKKSIRNEVSRGISNAYSYQDIARNLNNKMKIGLNKSIRIARTEGHRVTQESTMDGMTAAKNKGADVVKQWDATLDSRTRSSHRKVDGEIKELDEKFSNGLRFPGDPLYGTAGEVINCRCVLLQRAKWALGVDELETLQERAEYYGLDKTENFKDFSNKYLEINDKVSYNDIVSGAISGALNPNSKAARNHANLYYEEVRKMKTDTAKISKSTGYKKELIDDVKNHLFIDEHELEGGVRRFDSDYEIAQSWQRLILGTDIKEQDYVLLNHEYYELTLMKQGYTQSEAHKMTEEIYNYAIMVKGK